ncbi:hypothetical protein BJG92_01755 [Arthrobacter sp. SO5]|uniref:hypothetical protein n=1 Tax=Arthrobacter sp. SO5 TaxID=1897055 RepID=UPI001E3501F5|nr:hypothetical protein [Arthrobacter sp. SO5]MCB5274225.1 hypothetical protein [Arthrobacter sp. SO5]
MAIGPQNMNIRPAYLSAAVLTAAALTLTGCGQLAAQDAPGTTSDAGARSAATEAAPATPAAESKSAATDTSGAAAQAPSAAPGAGAGAAAPVAAPAAPPAAGAGAAPVVQRATAIQAQGNIAATTAPAARTAQAVGTYQPSGANTGVVAGTALKPHNTSGADLVITQDGTVLDGLEIYGDIKVRAKNVTIKNSRLHGGKGTPGANTGVIDANSAAVANLVVQDSTIIPDSPSYYRDGIVGHDYTAQRNHIQGTNDGLGIFNRPGGPATANVRAEGNYIHSLTYWSNDPAHSNGTHNDGIQVQGGENIRIAGNTVVANSNPGAGSAANPRGNHAGIGIMLQQNVAKLANVVVEKNWVDDGQTSINIDNGKYANITVTVSDNYLGRNQFDFGSGSKYPVRIISRAASTTPGLATNRWADNLSFLVEGKTGGIRYNA